MKWKVLYFGGFVAVLLSIVGCGVKGDPIPYLSTQPDCLDKKPVGEKP